jgi:hypothetical protein
VAFAALADLVVLIHLLYVGFVVLGVVLISAGGILGWRWVRNLWFRLLHLVAIAAVCVEALTEITCPLSTLENSLRQKAGQTTYPGSFLGHWAHALIFYDFPAQVFIACYLAFGAVVIALLLLVPPDFSSPKRPKRGTAVRARFSD